MSKAEQKREYQRTAAAERKRESERAFRRMERERKQESERAYREARDIRWQNYIQAYCPAIHGPERVYAHAFHEVERVRKRESKGAYYAAREKRRREYSRAFRAADSEWAIECRAHKYGITPERFHALYKSQNGKCAICLAPETDVDHCHTSGRVRGLLCHSCNTGLGQLDNDPKRICATIAYLACTDDLLAGIPPVPKYPSKHPNYKRDMHLRYKYGIALNQYNMLRIKQRGCCAICKNQATLCVDHDHDTKRIRGLLCQQCNLGIDNIGDHLGAFCYLIGQYTTPIPLPPPPTEQQMRALINEYAGLAT